MSGLMDTLQMDVRLTVPNDLVVEGERSAAVRTRRSASAR